MIARHRLSAGFTLVEILVATVILFFTIASVSAIINSANLATSNANKRLSVLAEVPLAIDNITLFILTNQQQVALSGEGSTPNTTYEWQAQLAEKKSAAAIKDDELNTTTSSDTYFLRWQVDLIVRAGALERNYSFAVSDWEYNE